MNCSQIKYCSKCILPNTRPYLEFDANGKCNCAEGSGKANIDWTSRYESLVALAKSVKSLKRPYDCVIPVSGGKDSTWQVVTALELGLTPLCVTWRSPARNRLGQKNLDNLISLGVTHFDVSINPVTEQIFTLKSFERLGVPLVPMHMAMHAITLQIAINFKVPLIIWGENSAFEYGGEEHLQGVELNHEWLLKYGVTHGTTWRDWIDAELTEQMLAPYRWPSDQEQRDAGVRAVFLGHFIAWDPEKTKSLAEKHGFKEADTPATGLYNYADVDDAFLITIHHWMKWYKFGFTRLWDNLSLEIRNGRMTREEAIQYLVENPEPYPEQAIDDFCKFVAISRERFFEIANKFRNPNVWQKDQAGEWFIPDFITDTWQWANEST